MNVQTVLSALPNLIPLMGQAMAVKTLVEEVVASFNSPADQATLREAIADLQAENDEGHRRFQEKLAAAAKR